VVVTGVAGTSSMLLLHSSGINAPAEPTLVEAQRRHTPPVSPLPWEVRESPHSESEEEQARRAVTVCGLRVGAKLNSSQLFVAVAAWCAFRSGVQPGRAWPGRTAQRPAAESALALR